MEKTKPGSAKLFFAQKRRDTQDRELGVGTRHILTQTHSSLMMSLPLVSGLSPWPPPPQAFLAPASCPLPRHLC